MEQISSNTFRRYALAIAVIRPPSFPRCTNRRRGSFVSDIRIFVVPDQLNRIFEFCTVYSGLLGDETVRSGRFNACAEMLVQPN